MTLRQALTVAAFFAGFAVHAQAASIIADDDLSTWKLHKNGTLNDWTPYSLIRPSQNAANNQTGLAPNILKELMRNNSDETGGFAIYFSRDNSFEYSHDTINVQIGKSYKSRSWNHGLANSADPNDPWHPGFKQPTPIKAWVLVNHIGQLFYTGKPFTHRGSHKNNNHHVIVASAPLLSFGDIDTHWSMHCANDENQVNSKSITVPEPASLALLLLGLLALAIILLQREKPLLSCPSTEPLAQKTESTSRVSSAKLLRRDVRNNILLFKFLHQRKYTIL